MLKQLILTRKLQELRTKLAALPNFDERKAEMKKREEDLETAINEITDETSEEDKKAVDDSVEEFGKEQKILETEDAANDETKKNLEEEIEKLQKELDDVNDRAAGAGSEQRKEGKDKKREDEKYMRNRNIFGDVLKELVTRSEVKDFIGEIRGLKAEKRAVTGAALTIPIVMLDLLRDNMYRYSKLITKVRFKPVNGKARQNITGVVPEGVWTEAVGSLNELALSFSQIEVDGYKVGGFIPVPNSTLEDSDLNLANEIMDILGQAIGLAIDKAILYGTGTKMPIGILTRLAQTVKPGTWGTNAPTWTDLHVKNLVNIDSATLAAEDLFAALIVKLGIAAPNYSDGKTFWAMNRKTRMQILSAAITINAAGAIVAGFNNTMPIEGGDIVELDFIPDGDIVGGFGSLYLLAERAGAELASSEHVKFVQDQTVFRGTARYDGMPVIGEGFVAVNINNVAPTTTKSFTADTAN